MLYNCLFLTKYKSGRYIEALELETFSYSGNLIHINLFETKFPWLSNFSFSQCTLYHLAVSVMYLFSF